MIKLKDNLWINPDKLIDITQTSGRTQLRYRANDAGIARVYFDDMTVDEVATRVLEELAKDRVLDAAILRDHQARQAALNGLR